MTKKYCEICKKEVMSKNFSRHINSKKHAKNRDILKVQNGGIFETKNRGEEVQNKDKKVQNEDKEVKTGGNLAVKKGDNLEVKKGEKVVKTKTLFTKRKEKIGADRTEFTPHGGDIRDSSTKLLPSKKL